MKIDAGQCRKACVDLPLKQLITTKITRKFAIMGRGDIKTKRGKRWHGSFGKARPKLKKGGASKKAAGKPAA